MNIQQINDKAYKYLFSNPELFHQLLKYFVDEEFIQGIHPEDLVQVTQEFISEEFLKRESDLIYRVRNKNLYIFVLMELQSTPQPRFPLRMLNYVSQFYETQSRKQKHGELLPNVFPLLLYNGKRDWQVPFSVQELFRKDIPAKYIPQLTYYPILIKNIPEGILENIHSTVSAMMILEKAGNTKAFEKQIYRLMDILSEEKIINKQQLSQWANILFQPEQKVDFTRQNPLYSKRGEEPMLAELAQQMRNEAREQGIEQGIEKGRKEGFVQDKQIILKKQLSRKFQSSKNLLEQIVTCTNPEKLDLALEEILTAETAEDVLELLK